MPNPHYQHVLEQDRHLPAPVRWLTRAMSSWWTITALGVLVVGYVAFALVPVGGRYLWQQRLIDSTQQQVLTWWPLIAGAWLLAVVILWAGFRRLPWRITSLGRMVCILGLAIILVSQSLAFNGQTTGVVAVPVSSADESGKPDPLSLTYTTRFGDPTERVLVVMVGGAAPINVPLDGLPRWNDAAGDAMPTMKLHNNPQLAATLGFETRVVPVAYLADGTLTESEDGEQTATPTPSSERDTTALPYPANALVAIEITTEQEDGTPTTTTAWLPFEPEGTDSLAPKRFFSVEGRGSIGLAFRPASRKLPFAVAASEPDNPVKYSQLDLHLADADREGNLLQPARVRLDALGGSSSYRAVNEDGRTEAFGIEWEPGAHVDTGSAILVITSQPAKYFITAGLITFVLGVVIDCNIGWLSPKTKRNAKPKSATPDAAA